jgi:hypothetical protein
MGVKRRRHVPTDAAEVHASQHATAGADPITPGAIGAPTLGSTPSTQAFGDAAAGGADTTASKNDHKHAMPALQNNSITLSSTAGGGSAVSAARSDAVIAAFDATAPSTQAFGDAAAVGSIAFAARRDHKHAMPADPVTAHAAAADPHTGYVQESLIDAAGDLIVGTADNTVGRLAKGTALQVLRTNAGATALEWAAPSAGSVASDSIWTAAGQVAVGTGSGTAGSRRAITPATKERSRRGPSRRTCLGG